MLENRSVDEKRVAGLKAYQSPQLFQYGNVERLTQGGVTKKHDCDTKTDNIPPCK